ncbi:MAG: protein translocase subunit SecF [Myxococcota bacterium]
MFEDIKRRLDAFEFDFVGQRVTFGSISAVLVVLSWVLFAVVGPNWGIDFTGGTQIQVQFEQPEQIEIRDLRTALKQMGVSGDSVQSVNGDDSGQFIIRIQDPRFGMEGLEDEVRQTLEDTFGAGFVDGEIQASIEVSARFVVDYTGETRPFQEIGKELEGKLESLSSVGPGTEDNQIVITVGGIEERIEKRLDQELEQEFEVIELSAVGPKVGGELRRQGFVSIAATLALVLLYVAFRFDVGFAPGAVVALFHDVSLTIGVFVLFGLEVNLPMIGALLTIVGYSLNDTIVIYDRIRENRERHRRTDLPGLINTSISETLTRTVATSLTTLVAIAAFLILGGPVIRNFAIAMLLGIVFGTYSTIFVASPMIIVMERVKPYLQQLIAVSDDEDEDDDGGPPLTESEKRRRAREADNADPA